MSTEEILDHILVPRPNGSEALEQVAAFLAERLASSGALVSFHAFTATPHGFELAWTAALLLVFCAHYDTTTHFGDHLSWGAWGFGQGPATAAAVALALVGLWRRRRGRELPRRVALPIALLAAAPFAAMFWFQTLGPWLRAPSPGAIDNGGSVAALLRVAEELGARRASGAASVKLVFLAAEEERALGSWAYAQTLGPDAAVAVVNLESVGASDELGYLTEDGFALRRFRSPDRLVAFVNETARGLWGAPLRPRELPPGTLTDGRSFLAHGLPALTLRAFTPEGFPRLLHSEHDSRERLSISAIERSVELLRAIVARADADPTLGGALPRSERR